MCCFSLDRFVFIVRIDRSVVSWFKIARSKSFDQVLNKTLRILVDHVTDFFDLKVSCDCVLRSVIASIYPYLLNLESSSVEFDLFCFDFKIDRIQIVACCSSILICRFV